MSSNHNMQPVTVYVNRVDQGRHVTGSELIFQVIVTTVLLPFYHCPRSFFVSVVKPYRAASRDTIVRSVVIEEGRLVGHVYGLSYCF